MIVAIDGPAGAGKSTVARALAERLKFRYLDTGAMYRALTWLAMHRGLDLGAGDELAELARTEPVVFDTDGRVQIAGTDVTSSIREQRIDRMVPVVARHAAVREVMRERQRELGRVGDVVIEGRDIGTVVAPDAEVKVYLVADRDERARRRMADRPGIGADALATDLRMRDEKDAERMQPAVDAREIDTTGLRVEDVVERIEALVHERTAA
jgi:CMP/dCMP kinase